MYYYNNTSYYIEKSLKPNFAYINESKDRKTVRNQKSLTGFEPRPWQLETPHSYHSVAGREELLLFLANV